MLPALQHHAGCLRRPSGCLFDLFRLSLARCQPFIPCAPSYARRESTTSDVPTKGGRDVIFSGIQPTGIPHLGNYLGALREWVKLQHESLETTSLYFSVVDLHALTGAQDASQLKKWTVETMAALIAVGLKPERCTIFYQSEVATHTQLMWILSAVAGMGHLSRMTQWKSKLSLPDSATPDDEATRAKLKLGLFSYPVLQAADILVHRANLVPVGSDQEQHIEFARILATSFNHHYKSEIFPLPSAIISPAKRVMSLKYPSQKMSKSAVDARSRILITDDAPVISEKIRLALTDSIQGIQYDPSGRPGISNLIELLSHFSPNSSSSDTEHQSCEDIAAEFGSLSKRAFKEHVAETITKNLKDIRERYLELTETKRGKLYVETVAIAGREAAGRSAESTLDLVKEAVGLIGRRPR